MFLELTILNRRGADVPPTASNELIRVDLVQRVRVIEVDDVENDCVELVLDNDETIACCGTAPDIIEAINQLTN